MAKDRKINGKPNFHFANTWSTTASNKQQKCSIFAVVNSNLVRY